MKKYLYAAICLLWALLGIVAGGVIELTIAVSNLPPDPLGGDGFGVVFETITGAFWGAMIGLGIVCCLLWRFLVQRRTLAFVSGAVSKEVEVWPPAPRMQVSGAVNAPSGERPSDAE